MLPKVSDLLVLEDHPNADAICIRVRLKPLPATQTELARRLAIDIVHRLTEPVPTKFDLWYSHLTGGTALSDNDKLELLAFVSADFADLGNATRLQGAVVEHFWAAIADELDGGWGLPLHVEHDHFTVIDHGPDGLSIYDAGHPTLGFRLWESKRYDADEASITSTITTAANQLRDHGPEYLARVAKLLQLHEEPAVATLGGTIVRNWIEDADTKAVGVSVGRSADDELPARPFIGLGKKFTFDEIERREGVVLEMPDLEAFAIEVGTFVLTGLN